MDWTVQVDFGPPRIFTTKANLGVAVLLLAADGTDLTLGGKFHPGPEGAPLGPEGAILGPEGAPSGPKIAPSGPKGAPSGPG